MTLLDPDTDLLVCAREGLDLGDGVGVTAAVTVVVVDSHAPVRDGLPLLLRPQGIEVVAGAATGDDALALVDRHLPDVVLVALDLVDVDGVVLLRRLVQRGTRSAIVLYTDEEDGRQAALAVRAGAAGVIAKRRTIPELAEALQVVGTGGVWLNEGAVAADSRQLVVDELSACRTAALSDAELRVLTLVAEGSSTEEIADALSLSPHTVRTHLRNVMRKLEASTRAHAVAIAIREAAIAV